MSKIRNSIFNFNRKNELFQNKLQIKDNLFLGEDFCFPIESISNFLYLTEKDYIFKIELNSGTFISFISKDPIYFKKLKNTLYSILESYAKGESILYYFDFDNNLIENKFSLSEYSSNGGIFGDFKKDTGSFNKVTSKSYAMPKKDDEEPPKSNFDVNKNMGQTSKSNFDVNKNISDVPKSNYESFKLDQEPRPNVPNSTNYNNFNNSQSNFNNNQPNYNNFNSRETNWNDIFKEFGTLMLYRNNIDEKSFNDIMWSVTNKNEDYLKRALYNTGSQGYNLFSYLKLDTLKRIMTS